MSGDRALRGGLTSAIVLSLWLGATIVVTVVVSPAAFAVLPTRTLAGALVGRVLPALFWSGAAVGLVAAVLGRGGALTRVRLSGILVTSACLGAQLVVSPRIARLRADAGIAMDRLPRDDALRVEFGRLHAASVALLGVAALAGTAALFFTVRTLAASGERHGIPNPPHEL